LIGVIRESKVGETRVAATPTTVRQLIALGYDVVVEPGAGNRATFSDEAYSDVGAELGDPLSADVLLTVNAVPESVLDFLKPGATLIGLLSPGVDRELVSDLSRRPITALALDAVPRISRAQSLDVLSSMANIA